MAASIVIAKPGLDGHDRGAKLVARALRDAGFEVVYTGIRQTPAQIAAVAVQEDADIVGLSILSGAHIGLTRKVAEALRTRDAADIAIVVGGTIPAADTAALIDAGARAVYPTGSVLDELVGGIRGLVDELSARDPSRTAP